MGYFDYEIISHELAHQWFGDAITCASWLDIWLNEGFATYCTGLCYEFLDAYWWSRWKRLTVENITRENDGFVYPKDTLNVSALFDARLTYRKAAYVLHMIRWTIGEDNFFQAIRNYLSDKRLKYAFAKSSNLIQYFEQEADTSLTQFMNDWYYGEGYPIYHLEWNQNPEKELNLRITQASSMNDGHFFAMYLPIRLIGETDSLDLRLKNTYSGELYTKKVDFKIKKILFDPDNYLISKGDTVDVLLNSECTIYPNPVVDILHIKAKDKIVEIKIFQESGSCYLQRYPQKEKLTIKTDNWEKGIYFLKIKTNSFVKVYKLIKE